MIKKAYPLFVTWMINETKDLRGCIGTFELEKLDKNLKNYALIAALEDERFDPICKDEIQHLHVCVSLLVDFEKVSDLTDWEIGVHGININFKHRGKFYTSTYLPEVAEEEDWDQETTLKSLVKKSGFSGKFRLIKNLIQLVRYRTIKVNLSFHQYSNHFS